MDNQAQPAIPLILIVDDDWLNRELLEGTLTLAGYAVVSANSGQRALQLARQRQPQVIVLDVNMPDLNGYEVCLQVRATPATAHIPVIMVSAADQSDEAERALAVGADGFLSRVRITQELPQQIERLLAGNANQPHV
ncbi:MAG: response regulator [bacterium]|nr:response regulator [bacterium]